MSWFYHGYIYIRLNSFCVFPFKTWHYTFRIMLNVHCLPHCTFLFFTLDFVVHGVRDLFWMPIEQYRKDGRIIRGLQRGAASFGTSTASAALELSNRLVQAIQVITGNKVRYYIPPHLYITEALLILCVLRPLLRPCMTSYLRLPLWRVTLPRDGPPNVPDAPLNPLTSERVWPRPMTPLEKYVSLLFSIWVLASLCCSPTHIISHRFALVVHREWLTQLRRCAMWRPAGTSRKVFPEQWAEFCGKSRPPSSAP